MKIEVLQENLNSALSIATRIISSKPQLPVLSNVLISVQKSGCTITSSNVESTIVVPFGAKIEEEGEILVPGRTLQELVASLSESKITLETTEGSLLASQAKFKGKIICMPATDFQRPIAMSQNHVTLPKDKFQLALSQTVFASATDEGRAVLNGVLFKFGSPDLMVSTDGFRLSRFELDKQQSITTGLEKIIIPSKTLNEVTRLLNDSSKEEIHITFEQSSVLFEIDEIKFYSQAIAGNYPEFEKIIPSEFETKIKLSTEELEKAIKTAAIFARENANIIRLSIDKTVLSVKAQGGEVGENETEIDIEVQKSNKESFSVAFNFRYILDFINSLGNEKEITIEFGSSTSPALFRPVKNENYLHIIMPVRVQTS